MSLEAVIQENTNTMRELIAVWSKLNGAAKAIDAKVEAGDGVTITAAGKPVAEVKPTKTKAEPKVEAPIEKAPEPVAEQPAAADAPAIAVADVNAAIIALAKAKGRDAAVGVLGKFGVAKVPELKPEQYADVLAAVKAAS